MKLGTLLRDVTRGLWTRPATVCYPAERRPTPPQLRGQLTWNAAQCTGCGLCVKDCPAEAIRLETLDKKAKRFVMHYAADQCVYCGQCVVSCRFDCLALSPSVWELAELDKAPLRHHYGDPADVAASLADKPDAEPQPAG
jgi:formate hydrogenlyase subunit 6/NADH:ubiquinone oxidoreductase subunit I